MKKRGKLFLGSLLPILLGPSILVSCNDLKNKGITQSDTNGKFKYFQIKREHKYTWEDLNNQWFPIQIPDGWIQKVKSLGLKGNQIDYSFGERVIGLKENTNEIESSGDSYLKLHPQNTSEKEEALWSYKINTDVSYKLTKNSDNANDVFYVVDINEIELKNAYKFKNWIKNGQDLFFNTNSNNQYSNININWEFKIQEPRNNRNYYNEDSQVINHIYSILKKAKKLHQELIDYNTNYYQKTSGDIIKYTKMQYFKNNFHSVYLLVTKPEIKDYLQKHITNLTKVIFRDNEDEKTNLTMTIDESKGNQINFIKS